jgi:hypothetical protein
MEDLSIFLRPLVAIDASLRDRLGFPLEAERNDTYFSSDRPAVELSFQSIRPR